LSECFVQTLNFKDQCDDQWSDFTAVLFVQWNWGLYSKTSEFWPHRTQFKCN